MTFDIHTQLGQSRMSIDQITKENLTAEVDLLIGRMDNFGIEKAVLTSPGTDKFNDLYHRATMIYPDRLFFACTLVPRPIENAKTKLLQYIDQGCKALVMDERMYHSSDPAAHALLKTAIDSNIAIYFQGSEMRSDIHSFIDRTSIMYPAARLLFLHMGGLFSFPNLIPLVERDNIWFDISLTLTKLVESPLRSYLDALVQDIGVLKLVFGSAHHTEYHNLKAAMNMIDLNFEQNTIITTQNAEKIIRL
ncbi:MAG: amidohydrolase family protein [Candidatus Thorarchaeota archaeon]